MFQRVLIANRGEIAVRIMRACRELGVETVSVYSQADADALHVQLATQSVCIGPAKASDSYLNVDALLTVAKETGCDAVHPGYGFLSENADFSDRCAQMGLAFIGPSGDVIRTMGNKSAARELMQKHNVPVVPGSDGAVETAQQAQEIADAVEACRSVGNERIVLLKCTSEYPAVYEDMNIATMVDMRDRFGCAVGLSDHSMGWGVDVAAATLGASVIEKHYCISREQKTVDSEFSMEPAEFKAMVRDVRRAKASIGCVTYNRTEKEENGLAGRRSLYAV